jgi:hypothetical protein
MNERKIQELQKQFGYDIQQSLINSGEAWKIGGNVTKSCKEALKSGACYLPYHSIKINIFVTVPSRYQVKANGYGSVQRSKKYWADSWNLSREIGRSVLQTV